MKRNTQIIFSLFSVAERRSRVLADKTTAEIVGSFFCCFLRNIFCIFFPLVCFSTANHRQKVYFADFHHSDKAFRILAHRLLFCRKTFQARQVFREWLNARKKEKKKKCIRWCCRRNQTHRKIHTKCFAPIFSLSLESRREENSVSFSSVREWKLCRLMINAHDWTVRGVRVRTSPKCHFRINSSVNKTQKFLFSFLWP